MKGVIDLTLNILIIKMHVELYWGQRFVVSIVFEQRTEAVSIYGTEGWSVLYCALPLPLWAHLLPKVCTCMQSCKHQVAALPSACQNANPFIRPHDHRAEPCVWFGHIPGALKPKRAVTVTMNDPVLVVADSARIRPAVETDPLDRRNDDTSALFRCISKVKIFSLSFHRINLWTHA
jgi:hypothetical protein